MKKQTIIGISALSGILTVLCAVYIFLVPKLINLNTYKTQIEQSVKDETGLGLTVKNVGFKTNLNLSIDVFAKDALLSYPNSQKLMNVDNVSLNISLIPLLFKEIEIQGFKINHPNMYISRGKNGEYSIETILKNLKPSSKNENFKLVKDIDLEITDYKLNLDDNFYAAPKKLVLAGDLIKISNFNPEKHIKLETKGKLLVQDKPNVTFNVKFQSELPFANSQAKTKNAKNQKFDPLDGIVKYDFKSNIIADLNIKNVQETPNIDGFLNFDGLTLKIKDRTLPSSYGKVKFNGNNFDVDSKLYITPESYVSALGNIKDITKNQLNLKVTTSDISFIDLKNFLEAINDVAQIDMKPLNACDISGKLKADFNIGDNSNFKGYLYILNTNIAYKGISKPLRHLNSTVNFNNNKLNFTNTYGYIDNNKFNLTGAIDSNNNADLKFALNSFNLKTITDLVNQSSLLKQYKSQLKDISSLSGNIKAEAAIKGNLNDKMFPNAKITLINPSISHKKVGFPVNFSKGTLLINDKNIVVNGVQANILQSPILISGNIADYSAKTPQPELFVKAPKFSVAKIKSLSNSPLLDKSSKQMLASIKNPSGYISANIKVFPDQTLNADMSVNNVSAYYAPSRLPIRLNSGSLSTDGKKLTVRSLVLKISNSPVKLSGTVTSLAKLPAVDLNAKGLIAASDVKKYSSPDLRKSIKAKGDLPFNASIAGYVDGWNVNMQANIDNLSYGAKINNSGSKLLKLNIKGNPSSLSLIDSGISTTTGQKLVSIAGGINRYSSKNPVLNNVNVGLSNLNLSLVEPSGRLQLNGNVALAGNTSRPKATGSLSVKNASIPSMHLNSDNIALTLKNDEILVNTGLLNVIDSKFKISMALKNNLSAPYVIKNMDVTSSYVNADKLQQAFPAIPNQDLPVIVQKGEFHADKMVVNALKNSDTSFDFVINPMNILKITNLTTSSAGGTASGKIQMNLKTSKVTVDLNTKDMEINTLASAFANTPNEIYGAMDGNIDLTTYGYTPEQMANNAQGEVAFTATNGKLTRIGNITHLMKAKNILSGGIGLQTINNILAFREADNSNQFKKLAGNITVDNGVMYINELSSQGGDMSLFTKGSIHINNNIAELTTYGTLSDRITSKLGKIPDFSVEKLIDNKILKKLPGQWGEVIADLRPKSQYPDLQRIPSLSRGNQETDRHFMVKIQGNFYKPGSVKSFKFID